VRSSPILLGVLEGAAPSALVPGQLAVITGFSRNAVSSGLITLRARGVVDRRQLSAGHYEYFATTKELT
jgi:hypothetical protein